MKKRVNVTTDLQLENYVASKKLIEVWVGNEIDYCGKIFNYSSETITVRDGNHYIREFCSIRSRQTYFKVFNGGKCKS